ncbi:MAG: PAS domain-containing protein [Actinomycetota bacterium]
MRLGRRWADLPLGRKGIVVIALPLVGLLVSMLAFLWVGSQEDRIQSEVAQTFEVRDEIQQVSQLSVEAETGVRGFLLTRDEAFLGSYRVALEELPAALERLRGLVAENPEQAARVREVMRLADEQLDLIGVLAERADDPPTGDERDFLSASMSIQDELRAELAAMREEGARLLDLQVENLDRTRTMAMFATAGGGLLGLLGGLVAMLIFTSGVVTRVQRLRDNARRLDERKGLLQLPPGDDEIGRLGRQIAATGAQLEARQRELHEARQFLEQLIERSPVIIFRRNPSDLRTTFVSSNATRILGYRPEELIEDSDLWMDSVHPDDVEAVLRQTRAGIESGETRLARPRFRFKHKDGSWRWLESVIQVEYEDDEPRAILGYALDVTNRQRTEEELAERELTLSTILETSPDVIVIADDLGGRRYVSPSLKDVLGWAPEQALGGGPEVVHPEDRRLAVEQLRRASAGEDAVRARYRMRHRDGHWVWLDVRAQRLEAHDGSAGPKRARTEIILYAREISSQVELEGELRRAKEDAESSSRAKSEFLSRMSHELRTPLNAILGFAQILGMEELDTFSRDSVEEILKGGRHLLDLINEVLDIARIETGKLGLSLEPVQVSDVVNESIALVRPLAAQRDIVLRGPTEIPPGWHVMADRQRVKQALLNLLSNAVKYNRAGGHAELSCEATAQGHMRIRVADTGPGIPPERRDLLFSPFERLGAEHTGVEGTGLGLALTKVLIEAMGGAIEVESSAERGSRFTVSLLMVEAPVAAVGDDDLSNDVDGGVRRSRTLLYIEDNLSNLKLVEHILARRPEVKLHAAMQGRLGLDLTREHRPDLVLLDLDLPDISGAEVLSRLRDNSATRDIPVVIISADATKHQIETLIEAGARAYMTKPLDVQRFLDIVDESLESNLETDAFNGSQQEADEKR